MSDEEFFHIAKWRRPDEKLFPRIWHQGNGVVIRDLTSDLDPYFIKHWLKYYQRDEPLNRIMGTVNDPLAIKDVKMLLKDVVSDLPTSLRVSLVILAEGEPGADLMPVTKENPPRILGGNILNVPHKYDPPMPNIEEISSWNMTTNMQKILGTIISAGNLVNAYERYGVDYYMESMGLSVHPDMRGKGLGLLLLETQIKMCRTLGIPVTKTVFTNIGSQKIAERAGFELLGKLDYEDMKDEDGNLLFPGIEPAKSIVLMGRRTGL